LLSSSLVILSAYVPAQPVAPSTSIDANTVVVTWTEPSDNGSEITHYQIVFKDSTGDYLTELIQCDGSTPAIYTGLECTVLLDTLTASPFNLALGDSIDVRVTAYNTYGAGLISAAGSGANIVLVPTAPTSFQDVTAVTSASVIGLEW